MRRGLRTADFGKLLLRRCLIRTIDGRSFRKCFRGIRISFQVEIGIAEAVFIAGVERRVGLQEWGCFRKALYGLGVQLFLKTDLSEVLSATPF